jgi:hypothetical protein
MKSRFPVLSYRLRNCPPARIPAPAFGAPRLDPVGGRNRAGMWIEPAGANLSSVRNRVLCASRRRFRLGVSAFQPIKQARIAR